MSYVIEKNIPLPQQGFPTELRQNLTSMDIGDSFLIPEGARELRRVQRAAGRMKERSIHGWDYTTRKEGDTYRIWRTK